MYKNDSLFKKALQRYYFLRTQPNKMHKINGFVHRKADLCNTNLAVWVKNYTFAAVLT
jgi:hypothetical protein